MTQPDRPGQDDILLEDVLLALQKTFSRLSATTAARNTAELRDQARALIVGEVSFEFTVHVEPVPPARGGSEQAPGRSDTLRYCDDGTGFPLRLSGRIATDVRHSEAASPDASGVSP